MPLVSVNLMYIYMLYIYVKWLTKMAVSVMKFSIGHGKRKIKLVKNNVPPFSLHGNWFNIQTSNFKLQTTNYNHNQWICKPCFVSFCPEKLIFLGGNDLFFLWNCIFLIFVFLYFLAGCWIMLLQVRIYCQERQSSKI